MPPSPDFLSASHTPPIPLVDLEFNDTMDQTVLPAVGSLEVVIDGVPETPSLLVWTGPTTLRITIAGFALVSLVVNLVSQDVNLRGLNGSIVKKPQSVIGFP